MQTLNVATKTAAYDVRIGENALDELSELTSKYKKVAVVTDSNLARLYVGLVPSPFIFTIPAGERSKNLMTYKKILGFLATHEFSRADLVVAFGGGVVGDIVGFSAATYLRGIDYLQIPTTLLAMTDSAVGGKTAVNLPNGKNLVGAFYQPKAVLIDTRFLKTLPEREFKNGFGEIIKYGAITNKNLFDSIGTTKPDYENIIAACLKIKAEIVAYDEFDGGERQLLNFGHTLGHALEKMSGYKINHGTAVGIGMVYITRFSETQGLTEKGTADMLSEKLKSLGMPSSCKYTADDLFSHIANDKKVRGDKITLALISEIGKSFLKDYDLGKLK